MILGKLSLGFTVIELMVVLIVSAILSSIVIPNYTRLQTHAKYSHLKQTAYSIQMAVETFFLYHGVYPNLNSIEQLLALLNQESLIKQIPKNPFTKEPFSSLDPSGKVTYVYDESAQLYQLEVYDKSNETVLLMLSN